MRVLGTAVVTLAILLEKIVGSDSFFHDGFLREQLQGLKETDSKNVAWVPQRGGQRLRKPPNAVGGRVLKQGTEQEPIHVAILSNRLTATAVTIGSVCRSSRRKLHFHVFSTDEKEFQKYFDKLQDCRGSELELKTIDEATEALLELGFEPVWWQNEHIEDSEDDPIALGEEWGVQTPYTNEKHAHALNLLRFYLPYLPSLSKLDKFIFLDDDVILQRDIDEMFDLEFQPGIAMLAGCQHWKYNGIAAGNFETSWNMTVAETGYIGDLNEVCDSNKRQSHGCVRPGLEQELASLSQIFDAESEFASRPLDRRAFNMGLNIFDCNAWKSLKLTHRFEQWVDASNKMRLFPQDTLAFGLGLAYLALGDSVQCYEPGPISHLVGMSFVGKEGFEAAGWPIQKIREDAYALHYNGAEKPWDTFSSTCAKDKPTDFVEIWKKACEDAGICTCDASSDVATERRKLQMGASLAYTHTGQKKETTWLRAPDSFEADATEFDGDFFCGAYHWAEEDRFKLMVCEGPSVEPERQPAVRNEGMISCGDNQVLSGVSYSNGSFSGGICVTYPGYATTACYSTDGAVADLQCDALTEVGTANGGMEMECCELTPSR